MVGMNLMNVRFVRETSQSSVLEGEMEVNVHVMVVKLNPGKAGGQKSARVRVQG